MNRSIYDNYVKQVAAHGSITHAAKALKISQPALSQGLSVLEKELGFKIFNRRSNPITMTPEGKIYYEHIQRIDSLNVSFEKKMSTYMHLTSSKVVVAGPSAYIDSIIVPSVAALLGEHPEYDITIKTASVEDAILLANKGEVDLFISTTDEIPDVFELKKLYQEEIVLCLPDEDFARKDTARDDLASEDTVCEDFSCKDSASEDSIDISSLEDMCFIALGDEFPLQQQVNRYLEEKNFSAHHKLTVDQVSLAVDLVERGVGFCFASKESTHNRKVKTCPVGLQGRFIYLAYDKEAYLSDASQALIEQMRK